MYEFADCIDSLSKNDQSVDHENFRLRPQLRTVTENEPQFKEVLKACLRMDRECRISAKKAASLKFFSLRSDVVNSSDENGKFSDVKL